MKVIIERFEGDTAVIEIDKDTFANMDRKLLSDAEEGDVINITIEKDETKKRKDRISALMNDLFVD